MSYLHQTGLTDYGDVLGAVYAFAVANGWTGSVGNPSFDLSGGGLDGPQIGIGNTYGDGAYICMGESGRAGYGNPQAVTSMGIADNDAVVYCTSIDPVAGPTGARYWGHAGCYVDTPIYGTDNSAALWNGLGGTSMQMWSFSEASGSPFLNFVVEDNGNYTHISMGYLDMLGMSTPTIGFVTAQYQHWFEYGYGGIAGMRCNTPGSVYHISGQLHKENYSIWVHPSTLPVGWGPVTHPQNYCGRPSTDHYKLPLLANSDEFGDHWNSAATDNCYLDGLATPGIPHMDTTLGMRQYALPVFLTDDNINSLHCCVGAIPGVRMLSDGRSVAPGGLIQYGTQDWVIFPWCRYGLEQHIAGAIDEQRDPNTLGIAFAYQKNP